VWDLPYGSSILPGLHRGKPVDIVTAFEAVGRFSAGEITEEERHGIECAACPEPGLAGGMYTANTMDSGTDRHRKSWPENAPKPSCGR